MGTKFSNFRYNSLVISVLKITSGKTTSKIDEHALKTTLLFHSVTSPNAESASFVVDADYPARLVPTRSEQRRELDQTIDNCLFACRFQNNQSKVGIEF